MLAGAWRSGDGMEEVRTCLGDNLEVARKLSEQ